MTCIDPFEKITNSSYKIWRCCSATKTDRISTSMVVARTYRPSCIVAVLRHKGWNAPPERHPHASDLSKSRHKLRIYK